jgi:TRAP-type C4-dicarboxylate transport system permease small subunit
MAMASRIHTYYVSVLRFLVLALCVVSGIGIVFMMGITCFEVCLRLFGTSMKGAINDILTIASAITISCALPYTTAVKGHVAIEFFFLKMNKTWRVIVDTVTRLVTISLFGVLGWRCVLYGMYLDEKGNVTMTLQLPTYWVMYILAFACLLVILVVIEHMLRPGKEMIRP